MAFKRTTPLRKSLMHRRTQPGAVPGQLTPDPNSPAPSYQIFSYGEGGCSENREATLEDLIQAQGNREMTWLNIEGLGDVAAIQAIGKAYHLHPLALEDVINVHQRPKLEAYPDVLFVVARMPHPEAIPETEQVSFFLGADFLITFQEGTPGDCFEPVRKRIRENSGRLRTSGPSYLLYALLDALIDQFFPQLEFYADLLENVEDRIISHNYAPVSSELYAIRRHLMLMQRTVRPLQDVIHALMRENLSYFDDEIRLYLRDCLDHTAQLLDLLETYRDLASHLMEMSVSAASTRMNEIMRFLTVMSSIFIPLTFVAGVYGMNFRPEASHLNMPELNWYYGYPFSLLLMASVALGLLLFFRHKGWLGIPESERHLHRR
ncbi:MAG: magnesium/cobalt transporter CorA [Candidatus Sericytochromatia bacterium]